MATLPAGLTQKDLDRYAQLDAGMRKIADEHAMLNAKIKKAHEEAGIEGKKTLVYPSEKYGAVIVDLGVQNRTDTKALEEAFPSEKYPENYSLKIDPSKMDAKIVAKFKNAIRTVSVKTASDD